MESEQPAPEIKPRNKGGRPRGARNKVGKERTPTPGWMRTHFVNCYTADEWCAKFKKLDDRTQFDILCKLEPRDLRVSDSGTKIELVIGGIAQRFPIDGTARPLEELSAPPIVEFTSSSPRALPEPVNDSRARQPHFPATNRPRPVVDTSPPDPEPEVPPEFQLRVPYGPPERRATPAEWRAPLFPVED